MNRIRELLRNEYSGAVAIGFLLAQAIGITISIIMRPINFYLERAAAPRNFFGRSDIEVFNWGQLVGPVINILLLGLSAFLLLQWLYFKPMVQEGSPEPQDTADADHTNGSPA